jgi:hypothetical protein
VQTRPQETPAQKRLRHARLELVNAHTAVDCLPTAEKVARDRVDDARKLLKWAEGELKHVLETVIPATRGKIGELEAEIAELEAAVEEE